MSMAQNEIDIYVLDANRIDALAEHIARHRQESGRDGDIHFMPFLPDDPDGPKAPELALLERGLDQTGWQRWWVAEHRASGRVIGHIDVRGAPIKAIAHRCELGLGIERPYRGRALGEALMREVINFCRAAPGLVWLDLKVFAHNHAAIRLYERLGFHAYGKVVDIIRLEGESIDDVQMTLNVQT
ncbi:MAG: GNAT family protein [Pseudomonadota bacterium]